MTPRETDRPYDPRTDYGQPPEIFVVETPRVSCEGLGGALGHPRVWLEMGDEDFIDCPYCDRRFVLKGSAQDPTAARAAGSSDG